MNKKETKELKKKVQELEETVQALWDNMAKLLALSGIQADILEHASRLKASKETEVKKDISYIR